MADPVIHRGAGILFLTPQGKALFLKRGNGGDAPGAWCFPGGTLEAGETTEECALREAKEELGKFPKGKLDMHTRSILPVTTINPGVTGTTLPVEDSVDFTTYVQLVNEEFAPQLNGEHTGWAWAELTQPPQPLHPGCLVSLGRFGMDELGVARAMADGQLTSPQYYGNMHLFDIRITGTGAAYRGPKHDDKGKQIAPEEYVYRRPENYLTDDFLTRCNGLQVIYNHPDKALLNSEEFNARTVGSLMLPYIKGDEVWAIAKIYDADMVKLLMSSQMSTSPAVLLGNGDQKFKLENGKNILVEGKPSLVDHIAICERGVWDKGGDPSGVRTDNQPGEIEMDKDVIAKMIAEAMAAGFVQLKTDLLGTTAIVRADAETGNLDKLLSHVDSFSKKLDSFGGRMDAFEKKIDAKDEDDCATDSDEEEMKRKDGESEEDFAKRKDAFEEKKEKTIAADKKRKDAEEKEAKEKADAEEAEHKKADAARSTENAQLRKELNEVKKLLPRQITDTERHQFASVQARCDTVAMAFGQRAPYPLSGEDVFSYRRRLASVYAKHSTTCKDVDVSVMADEASFKVFEDIIYKDAAVAALNPTDLQEGELREIARTDSVTGQRFVEFVGNQHFVKSMTHGSRHVRAFGAPRLN